MQVTSQSIISEYYFISYFTTLCKMVLWHLASMGFHSKFTSDGNTILFLVLFGPWTVNYINAAISTAVLACVKKLYYLLHGVPIKLEFCENSKMGTLAEETLRTFQLQTFQPGISFKKNPVKSWQYCPCFWLLKLMVCTQLPIWPLYILILHCQWDSTAPTLKQQKCNFPLHWEVSVLMTWSLTDGLASVTNSPPEKCNILQYYVKMDMPINWGQDGIRTSGTTRMT